MLPQSQQQLSPPPAEEQVELKTLLELNNFNDAERSKYVEKLIKDELNTNNFTEIEPSLKQKEKKRPTNQKRKKGKVEYDEYVGCDKDIDTNKYCIKSTKDKLEIRTNTNQKDVIKEIIKPVIDSLKIIEEGDHTYNTLNYTYMT